jgi:hypothetical protein
MVVERRKRRENIVALLGVHRQLLYKWRDQPDPVDTGDPLENPRESPLSDQPSSAVR